MIYQVEELVFQKSPNGNTVNIYHCDDLDYEIDCFTNYSIGADFDKFEDSCREHYQYLKENF